MTDEEMLILAKILAKREAGDGKYHAWHIWSRDTGGTDTSMYVQEGEYDLINANPFTPSEEATVVRFTGSTYAETQFGDSFKLASYVDSSWNWGVIATSNLFSIDGGYKTNGSRVRTWYYSTAVDFYILDHVDDGSSSGDEEEGHGVEYPSLPSGYKEVEYLYTDADASRPYIIFPGINSGDIVVLTYLGDGVIAGNEQSFNINVQCMAQFLLYIYGGYTAIWKSWEQVPQKLKTLTTIGLKFTSTYSNVKYGTWRPSTPSYTYTGNLYKLLIIDPYSFEAGSTPENIKVKYRCRIALIPCYRISDDVNGFYDTVNKAFYTAEQGTFVRGPEV